MSEIKLLPCPFCGGEARLMYYDSEGDGTPSCINYDEELEVSHAFVHCYNCDTDFFHHSDSAKKVLDMWNTRKPMERIVERLEEELPLYTGKAIKIVMEEGGVSE